MAVEGFGEWLLLLLGGTAHETPLAERLERVVLGGRRRYTKAQVSELTGVPPERAQRLWRALGFADVGDDDVVFTDGDLEALRLVDSFVSSGLIDLATEAAVARAVGHSMSRLAEWEINMLGEFLVARAGNQLDAADDDTVLQFAETILPLMEKLHSHVWRRHLAALSGRALAGETPDLVKRFQVVGFADVVGYTRMTRQLSEPELARLVDQFEAMATEAIASGHGRVVKTLGDEVMFVADEPEAAARIAFELLDRSAESDLPELRIGMAAGNVLSRYGDVYGEVVNTAARLTSSARPGRVLVDRTMASALGDHPAWRLRRRRTRSVRGYQHLVSFELGQTSPPAHSTTHK